MLVFLKLCSKSFPLYLWKVFIIAIMISCFLISIIHPQPSKVHHHINDNLPRVIGRLCGQKSLVNCIALEENESEDLVACGSTDTTVRVRTVRLEYIVLPERSSLHQHRPLLQSVFAFLSQRNVNVSQRSLRITTVVLLQQKATHTNFATHTHQHH